MKRIAVLGLGRSGAAAAALAAFEGDVPYVFDSKDNASLRERAAAVEALGGEVSLGWEGRRLPGGFDLVVTSPGISEYSSLMSAAFEAGVRIIGEFEYGCRRCRAPIVAVTGTNGKTTTVELCHHLLTHAGIRSVMAGNIGFPVSQAVLEGGFDVMVAEASSFQLQDIEGFAPLAAAILNIGSDHADRHESTEIYADAKFRVFRGIVDSRRMILNRSLLKEFIVRFPDAAPTTFSAETDDGDFFSRDGGIWTRRGGEERELIPSAMIQMPGRHNLENLMAAAALAEVAGAPLETLASAVSTFRLSDHRLELVASVGGVSYMNDSKSTNPDSLVAALRSVGGERNVCLVAGGLDKDMDFSIVASENKRVKKAFLIGKNRVELANLWGGLFPCEKFDAFEPAVVAACEAASSGDVVLLSPSCASMDMFKNYAERGDVFKEIIKRRLEK